VNTKALKSLADLICRAQENGRQTPMGIAMAIDAAGRHMSPEVAAELEQLRNRVADLTEALSVTTGALRENLAELEAPARVREVPDGEHYASVHHSYRLGHDLPPIGGAS
jgi:DNA-binding HxlR family transcriptional regulator